MLGESVKAQSRRGSLLSFAIKKGSGICQSLFCVVRRFRRADRDYDRLKYAAIYDQSFQPFERLTATPRSRYGCSIQISQTICPALLLSSLRDCCVPACRPSRRRSPLARFAPPKGRVTQSCDPFRPGRTNLFAAVLCFGTLPPLCLVKGARSSRNRRTIMKVEQAKQIVSKAIEELSQSLERGHSETLRNYLAAIGRFHRYSLRNVMLIASQKPSATHVAGFHAWHKLGRFVKKGEKGIVILAPIARSKNESAKQDETDESSTAVGFRAAYVFDINQTDGQELPEIGSVNGDPSQYRERLGRFIAEQDIALEYSQDIAPARGTSAGGKITLLPGQSPAEEFATLAHELAHEMMHRTERRSSTSKPIRETEAEAVAFVVSHVIGLETGSAAQDYIQLYEGDAKLLTASLEYIQKAATQILNAIGAEGISAPH